MLPPLNRLKKDKDFKQSFKKGVAYYSPIIRLRVVKNNLQKSRFGFVVSTKVDKRATKRNRLKRQLREIVRLELAKFKQGYDIVIMAGPKALGQEYGQLEKELNMLLKKAKIFKS